MSRRTPPPVEEPMPTIHAGPYRWPFDGDLTPANTALIVIDMQTDFCGPGGYVDKMGYAISLTRAPSSPSDACSPPRAPRLSHLAHARGPPPRSLRPSRQQALALCQIDAGIGDLGPCGKILVRGKPGWQIIPELAPMPSEPVVDKPGKGSFCATDLELLLRVKGGRTHRNYPEGRPSSGYSGASCAATHCANSLSFFLGSAKPTSAAPTRMTRQA